DLEEVYLDSFLTIARIPEGNDAEIERTIAKLETLGEKFNIKFVLSVSRDADKLPESVKKYVDIAL
nr:twitching motility protein PilT [Lachnospiraceae bacterium]